MSQLTGAGLLAGVLVVFVVVALVVAPRSKSPSSALAWILVITFVPVLGLLLFLVIGSPQLPQVRRERQQHMDRVITESSQVLDDHRALPHGPSWLPATARLNRATGGMPMVDGNAATILPTFDDQLAGLVRAVEGARQFVHVEFYILSLDATTAPFFAALEDAVRRGVEVRVLMDHLGSRGYPGYRATCRELDRIGAQWHLMLPVQPLRGRYQRPDLRNHRKLLVADGTLALVGSLNLIDPGYDRRKTLRRGLRWLDLLVEVRGPVVRELDAVFVTDWFSETEELLRTPSDPVADHGAGDLLAQVAPSGPAFATASNLALFTSVLYAAERRVSITSPYFVPDESLLAAITTAARRGVEVELFVGGIGDQVLVFHAQHSYYLDLLRAGVRIYEYPAPTILHAKHVSVDDDVSLVGSSNMDIRSFQLDLEIVVLLCGRSFTDQLRRVEDSYRAVSRELTLKEVVNRTRRHRIADDLARLTSAVQ